MNDREQQLEKALQTCKETFEWAKVQGGKTYQYAVEDLLVTVNEALAPQEVEQ